MITDPVNIHRFDGHLIPMLFIVFASLAVTCIVNLNNVGGDGMVSAVITVVHPPTLPRHSDSCPPFTINISISFIVPIRFDFYNGAKLELFRFACVICVC